MSRIYAREEDSGRRFLARIECDAASCRAFIRPNPNIAESGWIKCGQVDASGEHRWERDYCDDHAHLAPLDTATPGQAQREGE